MTNEVKSGNKIKASDINQLVNAVNNPQVSVVGQGIRSASIGGAMTIFQDNPLKGDTNQALPQLFSIKSGPSKKWVHKDGSGKVYPSLYVYLGPSPAIALETVNISDNLISEGDHPHIFLYFNLSKSENWKTHAYEVNPQTGLVGSVFDPVPTDLATIRKCMIDSTDNSVDGWYELPTSPLNAMPIWAVCYVSFGATPVLAFCTVDEIKTSIENTNALSAVEMLSYEPDLTTLGNQSTIKDAKMYIGLVGTPIKLYDLNPYSTDPLSEKFDADGKVNDGYEWITLYAANNGLTFNNPSDTTKFSVKPCCFGSRVSDHWKYWFYLSLPTQPKAPDNFDTVPFTQQEIDYCIQVQTIPEPDGDVTLYTLPQITHDSTTTVLQIASLTGKNREDIGQNVEIVPTTTQKAPLCAKGSVMGLGFELLSSAEFDMAAEGAVLFLMPVSMPHINANPFFVPKIVRFGSTAGGGGNPTPFLPSTRPFRACTIFPSGYMKPMQYKNFGKVPQGVGEGVYTKYGQLTPPYSSTSLVEMTTKPNTDSQMEMRYSQMEGVVLGHPWDVDPPGMASEQFGSIMWNPHTKNVSRDGGETWETDRNNPIVDYLGLYGFNRFDMDRKVNFLEEEAVKGIEVPGTGSTVRKDFDFVIRKRSNEDDGDGEGANIAYMRGFMPDSILDEGLEKARSLEFFDGTLEKDGVAHNSMMLYDFESDINQTVTINEDCKKLSEGYGSRGRPLELNMVARWVNNKEREVNYVDLDFSWVVDSILSILESLGPYGPGGGGGGGGGLAELGQVVDDLSAKCDLDWGDFWIRGRDGTYNYGTSIGDSGQNIVIDLDANTLKDDWIAESDLTVKGDIKAENKIDFTQGQGLVTMVDGIGTWNSTVAALDTYDVSTGQFGSIDFPHITTDPQAIGRYATNVADQLFALNALIQQQNQTIAGLNTTIQQLQADIATMQGAIATLQTNESTMQGQIANHEQRLQNGGL